MNIEITLRFAAQSRKKWNSEYLAFVDNLVGCKTRVEIHILYNDFLATVSCFPRLCVTLLTCDFYS